MSDILRELFAANAEQFDNLKMRMFSENEQLREINRDLYEALEICLGHITGGIDGDWSDCDPAEKARAALAKARGER